MYSSLAQIFKDMQVNDMGDYFYKLKNNYRERYCAPSIKSGFTIILLVHFFFHSVFSIFQMFNGYEQKWTEHYVPIMHIYIFGINVNHNL